MRIILFVVLSYLCISTAQADSPKPSREMIQAWWKSNSDEEMRIEGDILEIHLRDKAIAYLAQASFNNRGRNDTWHAILIRPELEEVREVDEPVRSDIEVYDLDHDGVSEVVAVTLGSGQGTTVGKKSIVQFDGWTPIVLYKADFEDNEGAYGTKNIRYFSRDISWRFVDLDKDGRSDLAEEITTKQGRNHKNPIITRITHKFMFKDGRFIRYTDFMRSIGTGVTANPSFQGTRRDEAASRP
jgi:hypothetical protein